MQKYSQPITIYGAGDHGHEIAALIIDINSSGINNSIFQPIFYLDDDKSKVKPELVLTFDKYSDKYGPIVLGIGSPKVRQQILKKLPCFSIAPSLVHPTVTLASNAHLGLGVTIQAGSIISIGVQIDSYVSVNYGCIVSHGAKIGKGSVIAPGVKLCGNVVIGEYSFIGAGATVIQNIKIGKNTTIGAGAVVINDIPDNATAIGVPAKVIKISD